MYTVDEILERLNNGEKSSTIAEEMACLLNDAIAAKESQEKKIAETARRKKETAQDIADRINGFLAEFYPDVFVSVIPDDIIAIGEGSKWLTELFKDDKNTKGKSADEIIANFLKDFNL